MSLRLREQLGCVFLRRSKARWRLVFVGYDSIRVRSRRVANKLELQVRRARSLARNSHPSPQQRRFADSTRDALARSNAVPDWPMQPEQIEVKPETMRVGGETKILDPCVIAMSGMPSSGGRTAEIRPPHEVFRYLRPACVLCDMESLRSAGDRMWKLATLEIITLSSGLIPIGGLRAKPYA